MLTAFSDVWSGKTDQPLTLTFQQNKTIHFEPDFSQRLTFCSVI